MNRIENSHRDYASEEKFRICISFGATDHGNVTGKVLMALKKLNRGFQIDIALSSAAPHINSVRSLISSMEVDAELQQDEIDMAKFFSRADLAIGAGGSTAWERSCLGIPSIVIITAENQKLIAQHLEKYGAAMTNKDEAAMNELLHDDFKFTMHKSGNTLTKGDVIKWAMSGDIKQDKVRIVYENNEVGIHHAFVTFDDGNVEAVMAVYKYKDGKIIALETGATPMPK